MWRVLAVIVVAYFGWFGFLQDKVSNFELPEIPKAKQITIEESWDLAEKLKAAFAEMGADKLLIASIKVEREFPKTITATVHVTNLWHYTTYQVRLQRIQVAWQAWAAISENDPKEGARLRIVDDLGNEVGGSGLLGSDVWVSDK